MDLPVPRDLPKATSPMMIAMVTAIILPNPKASRKVRDQKDHEGHHQIQAQISWGLPSTAWKKNVEF